MIVTVKGLTINIDDDLVQWVMGLNLRAMKRKQYIAFFQEGNTIYLHRAIAKCPKGKVVDHINGDAYDNRRCNLRVCSNANNLRHRIRLNKNNTSGKCGVYFCNKSQRWIAQLKHNRKMMYLGRFRSFTDAVNVRKQAEQKFWKQYKATV